MLVCHVIQFNSDVTLRPRFNAYVVVSVYKANLAFQCQKFCLAIPLLIGGIPVQKEKFGKMADQLLLNGCLQRLNYITWLRVVSFRFFTCTMLEGLENSDY